MDNRLQVEFTPPLSPISRQRAATSALQAAQQSALQQTRPPLTSPSSMPQTGWFSMLKRIFRMPQTYTPEAMQWSQPIRR